MGGETKLHMASKHVHPLGTKAVIGNIYKPNEYGFQVGDRVFYDSIEGELQFIITATSYSYCEGRSLYKDGKVGNIYHLSNSLIECLEFQLIL